MILVENWNWAVVTTNIKLAMDREHHFVHETSGTGTGPVQCHDFLRLTIVTNLGQDRAGKRGKVGTHVGFQFHETLGNDFRAKILLCPMCIVSLENLIRYE